MDEEDTTPAQMEQGDREPPLKRLRTFQDDPHDIPAAKATGKPVLNTRALRSVLKGKHAQRCMHARV